MIWYAVQRISGGRRWVDLDLFPEREQAASQLGWLTAIHGAGRVRVEPVVPWWCT